MIKKIFLFVTILTMTSQISVSQNKTINFVVKEIGKNEVSNNPEVEFTTEDGKSFYVIPFPGKKAHDLYTDVILRAVRKFHSMPVAPQTIEDRAFVLSGETDFVKYNSKNYDGSISESNDFLDYHILFEFKDGKVRVNAPIAPYGSRGGSLSYIYKNDKDAIKEIEEFFNALVSDLVFPKSDENW